MRKKPVTEKLIKNKEYRTPQTISWERTAQLYGNQSMSLGSTKVKDSVENTRIAERERE